MPVFSIQVTIPTGGGPVQVSSTQTLVRYVEFQNNASHTMRAGGAQVSSTLGHLLAASGGEWPIHCGSPGYYAYLSDFWVVGTAADVLDVVYVT
jgi:hypothetical protein